MVVSPIFKQKGGFGWHFSDKGDLPNHDLQNFFENKKANFLVGNITFRAVFLLIIIMRVFARVRASKTVKRQSFGWENLTLFDL